MANTWTVGIDWTNDGTYTDEASRVVSIHVRRGRDTRIGYSQADDEAGIGWAGGYEPVRQGVFYLTLSNHDGRYDPFNTDSELYGYLLPHRPFKMQVSDGSKTWSVITGWVHDTRPQGGKGDYARIYGVDGIDWLENQRCPNLTIQTDYAVSDAIFALLDETGWPFVDDAGWIFTGTLGTDPLGGALFDDNGDTIPYWWSDHNQSVWGAIQEISNAWAGNAYVSADGTFGYEARQYGGTAKLLISQGVLLKDMELTQPVDEIRNSIRIYAQPRTYSLSLVELWRLSDIPYLAAGESMTIWAEYQQDLIPTPAYTVASPVSTTDYTANALESGLGADLTADMDVTFTNYTTEGSWLIENTGGTGFYITLAKLRGMPLVSQGRTSARATDATSITNYGQASFSVDSRWMQEIAEAEYHAQYAKIMMASPSKSVFVKVEERPDYQFEMDLFDIAELDIPAKGISGLYYLTFIEHYWKAGEGCVTTWRYEPTPGERADFWLFTGTLGSDQLGW